MLKRLWNNAIIKVIVAYLVFEILSFSIKYLCGALGISFPGSNLGELISEIVKVTIPVLIVAFSFKTISTVKNPLKGLGKSLLCGLWFFLITGFGIFIQIKESISNGLRFKSGPEIIIFVLFLVAVCFSEELLNRGTITEILVRRFGSDIKGKILTILVGAFIFSVFHLTNLLRGQSVRNTVLQMISVFCMAVFVNTIYVRYRNLYAAILLHMALDFMTLFEFGMISGRTIEETFTNGNESTLSSFIMANSSYIVAAVIIFLVTNRKGGKKNDKKDS